MKYALLFIFWTLLVAPFSLKAGTPDEDPAVQELYTAYGQGSVPSLEVLAPGTLWHCTYYDAERGSFYRASTFMQFYAPRNDGVIRSVMRVTYPRRVTATTYFGFSAYGFLSQFEGTQVYISIRQTGPAQLVMEHFETREAPLGPRGTPARSHKKSTPGLCQKV